MKILLVSIGVFQNYIIQNIENLILHNNKDITVITEKKYFYKLNHINNTTNLNLIDNNELTSDYIVNYKNNSKLDKIFRQGFWYNASLRIFYIHAYMKKYNIKDLIHIENDVMIYEDLENIKNYFNKNKIYLPYDSNNRAILSLIYISNYKLLENILKNYDYSKNDMENFGLLSDDITESLPIIDKKSVNFIHNINKNFDIFNCIFDAAAIGQYLGGIDKANNINDTTGFINETCIIKYNNYKFYWIYNNNTKLWYPYIQINNEYIKIINLHIHSKNLSCFMSNNKNTNSYLLHPMM